MIQLLTATVNLQVQPRLHKLNGLKVRVLDSVLAVLLLIYALVFVLFYKHKYYLRYLKGRSIFSVKKYICFHPSPF